MFSWYFTRHALRSLTIRRGITLGSISSSAMLCFPLLSKAYADTERFDNKISYTNLRDLWQDFFFGGLNEAFGQHFRHSSVNSTSTNSGIARIDSSSMVSRVRDQLKMDVFAPHLPTLEWTLLGIFNGHSGSSTSEYLYDNLLTAVTGFLADVYSSYNRTASEYPEFMVSDHTQHSYNPTNRIYPPSEEIDTAIKKAFQSVDDHIINNAVERTFKLNSKEAAVNLLSPAMSGSGVILAFFDGHEKILKIAVAGGAGAVLGRPVDSSEIQSDESKYEVQVITTPQPTFKHPTSGEQRFMRSFGDGMLKWPQDIQKCLHERFLGDTPIPVSSHPEVTAEPILTTVEIKPGDFVIMANSGVWDCLTSDEAVGLVGVWLRRNKVMDEAHVEVFKLSDDTQVTYKVYKSSPPRDSKAIWDPAELPVVRSNSSTSHPATKGDKNLSWIPSGKDRKFINIDSNVASHIIRNAIGGPNTDLVRALENMDPIRVEKLRDDLGVQVIFFK